MCVKRQSATLNLVSHVSRSGYMGTHARRSRRTPLFRRVVRLYNIQYESSPENFAPSIYIYVRVLSYYIYSVSRLVPHAVDRSSWAPVPSSTVVANRRRFLLTHIRPTPDEKIYCPRRFASYIICMYIYVRFIILSARVPVTEVIRLPAARPAEIGIPTYI